MNAKNTAMTMIAVVGLFFLAGSGCSKDDKKAQAEAQALAAKLKSKQKELDCKVKILAMNCANGDSACETKKAEDLAACGSDSKKSDDAVSTASSTSTSTTTATN